MTLSSVSFSSTCSFSKVSSHTTHRQNPPTRQAHHHRSPLNDHSSKSPQTIPPLQNSPTKQPLQHCSPPHINSPKSPPHTTPPVQNPPNANALQSHSPPCVSSPMSPLYTTPPPQSPPNAPKKKDAIVDEPSKDPKTVMKKFYVGLKNYKNQETIVGLSCSRYDCKRILATLWQQRL
jgi:hypothetical protein